MTRTRSNSPKITQSVDRALTLFDHVVDHAREEHSLKTLSTILDIDKSSTFRLLQTLVCHGMLRQEGRIYRLGPSLYRIVRALEDQEHHLLASLRPVLLDLVEKTDEGAHAAVRAGNKAVFIACQVGTHRISSTSQVGDSEELYCTAIGKSLLCQLSQTELQQELGDKPLKPYTPHTPTSLKDLYQQLQKVKEEGIALDDEEYEEGVSCLAAPIYNHRREVIAAIGVSGLRHRIQPHRQRYTDIIRTHARHISRQFGFPD